MSGISRWVMMVAAMSSMAMLNPRVGADASTRGRVCRTEPWDWCRNEELISAGNACTPCDARGRCGAPTAENPCKKEAMQYRFRRVGECVSFDAYDASCAESLVVCIQQRTCSRLSPSDADWMSVAGCGYGAWQPEHEEWGCGEQMDGPQSYTTEFNEA